MPHHTHRGLGSAITIFYVIARTKHLGQVFAQAFGGRLRHPGFTLPGNVAAGPALRAGRGQHPTSQDRPIARKGPGRAAGAPFHLDRL